MRKSLAFLYRELVHWAKPNSGLGLLASNRIATWMIGGVDNTLVARLPGKAQITVERDDYDGRILWLAGSNDFKVERAIRALCHQGDVFFDIGANHGSIGFAALEWVAPTGAVHLVEPQSILATRLKDARSTLKTNRDNLHVHRVALYDKDGEMVLVRPETHSGRATLADMGDGLEHRFSDRRTQRETVKVFDARAFVAPLSGNEPFGIKLDVEGAEPAILKRLLPMPRLVFVAFEGNHNVGEIAEVFTRFGEEFAIFGLNRTFRIPRYTRVDALSSWSAFHDFIAVKGTAGKDIAPGTTISFRKLASLRSRKRQ